MSTTEHEASSAAAQGPTSPVVELVSREALELQRRFEEVLGRGETPNPQLLRDHHLAILGELRRDRPIFTLKWPDGWYIPRDADFRQYWVTEPPAGNRYTFGWGQSQLYPTTTVLT